MRPPSPRESHEPTPDKGVRARQVRGARPPLHLAPRHLRLQDPAWFRRPGTSKVSARRRTSGDGGEPAIPRVLLLGAFLTAVLAQALEREAEGQRPDGERDRVDL